jgi:hypothetical protein
MARIPLGATMALALAQLTSVTLEDMPGIPKYSWGVATGHTLPMTAAFQLTS